LRGGKYKQGKEYLQTKNGNFCCLGVLCDLYIRTKEGKKSKAAWRGDEFGGYEFASKKETEGGVLPREVKKWAGLGDSNPYLDNDVTSELNDETRVGFRGIANRIEKHL